MEKIWQFKDNEYVETDKIELKSFKPVGKFFEDVQFLTKHFSVKTHPALNEANYKKQSNEGDEQTS